MAEDQLTGSIISGSTETSEPYFIPPSATVVEFNLQPEQDFVYEDVPELELTERTFAMDVETTGLNPWDSRVISIGVQDLNEADSKPIVFIGENEKSTLNQFFAWLSGKGFTRQVLYNGAFDVRWLYAQAMRHRIAIPTYLEIDIYDIGQVLKQVFEKFVFGKNEMGGLDAWGKYLLGYGKNATIEQIFDAWDRKDYAFITSYNENDVIMTRDLYYLDQFVKGLIPLKPKLELQPESASHGSHLTNDSNTENPEETKTINCPECNQETEVPLNSNEFFCDVCKEEQKVPT